MRVFEIYFVSKTKRTLGISEFCSFLDIFRDITILDGFVVNYNAFLPL